MILAKTRCLHSVMSWAELYIKRIYNKVPDPTKMAVIFDIDETVYFQCPCQHQSPPEPLKRLYDKMLSYGFQVYFITSRIHSEANVHQTWELLKFLGFTQFRKLFLMPKEYLECPNASSFKLLLRDTIQKEGYHVILNIGNRWQDLILLPPFNTDPEAHEMRTELISLPDDLFFIIKPQDIAWMIIKFPTVGCTPWY